jgi:hypothetical protein
MGDSDLGLLFKLKGDNTSAKASITETRAAIATLRSSFGNELNVMQGVANRSFASITQNLNQFAGQVPVVGTAVSGLSSQFGALASPMGIATIATLALGGAFVSLSTKLFEVVEQSSKLGGQIHDLTQQTGLGAERLTALKFATDQSGGSIEKFSNGLKIFATLIANANKGSEEAKDALKRLGVDPKEGLIDLDAALNKALGTIAKTPAGVAQMTLAADAFGKKVGPDLIPTIMSFDGNLDALTKRARELGLTLTDVQVKSLDEFGDTFDTIKLQATLAAAQFSSTVAPEITRAMQRITQSVGENRGVFEQWGVALGDTMRGIRLIAESELGQVAIFIARLASEITLIPSALRITRQIGAEERPVEDVFGPGGAARGGRAGLPGTPEYRAEQARRAKLEQFQSELAAQSKSGGGKAKKKIDSALADALKESALAEREALLVIQANVVENKRALDQQVRDIEQYTARAIQLENQRKDSVIDRANSEFLALDKALQKKLITQKEFDTKWREQDLEIATAKQKNSEEVFKLEQERDRKVSEAELAANRRKDQIAEDADQRTIDRIKERIRNEFITEAEGERQIAAVLAEGFARRKKALEDEDTAYATSLERHKAIKDEIVRLDGERAKSAEDAAARILAAEQRKAGEVPGTEGKGAPATIRQTGNAFDLFGKAITDNLTGDKKTAALAGLGVMQTAFQMLGQAVGDAVYAFTLFGSAGIGLKKFTSTMIAEIGRMAAIQAVWELAQGLAMLALNFFWPDPEVAKSAAFHLHSSLVYAGLAGLAAAAGRATSGGSFAAASGSGGSGNRTAGGGSQSPANKPTEIEVDRRQNLRIGDGGSSASMEAAIERSIQRGFNGLMLRAEVTRDEGSSVRMWIENYKSNGRVRKLVREDAD